MKSHASTPQKKSKKEKRSHNTESLLETLELPKDLLMGLPLLSMEGNRTLCITNHRGIVRFAREIIVIAAYNGSIQITGRELEIPKFTEDIIEIRGYLEGVTFLS